MTFWRIRKDWLSIFISLVDKLNITESPKMTAIRVISDSIRYSLRLILDAKYSVDGDFVFEDEIYDDDTNSYVYEEFVDICPKKPIRWLDNLVNSEFNIFMKGKNEYEQYYYDLNNILSKESIRLMNLPSRLLISGDNFIDTDVYRDGYFGVNKLNLDWKIEYNRDILRRLSLIYVKFPIECMEEYEGEVSLYEI